MPDRAAPIADAVIAALALTADVVAFAYAATAPGGHDADGPAILAVTTGLVSIPIILPFGASAIYGSALAACPAER